MQKKESVPTKEFFLTFFQFFYTWIKKKTISLIHIKDWKIVNWTPVQAHAYGEDAFKFIKMYIHMLFANDIFTSIKRQKSRNVQ